MAVYRVGIDIGGTFTDLVAVNTGTGELFTEKLPTTPADPAEGLLNVLNRFLEDIEDGDSSILMVVHGTTTATNAVLEGKLPPAALITTKGFRDVLEIGRHLRTELYDIFIDKPKTLISRSDRYEVEERTYFDGSIAKEIDEEKAAEVIEKILKTDAKAIAVCFLNSYANPENEKIMKELINRYAPNVLSTASYEICREFREFERTSTVAMNAALLPVISNYINHVKESLAEYNGNPAVFIMQSNGGVASADAAKESPVNLLLSGPATCN